MLLNYENSELCKDPYILSGIPTHSYVRRFTFYVRRFVYKLYSKKVKNGNHPTYLDPENTTKRMQVLRPTSALASNLFAQFVANEAANDNILAKFGLGLSYQVADIELRVAHKRLIV
jgi:hypothetical protein